MIYRALAAAIVAFWVLMMALLVRVEFSSGQADLLPVPVGYVWKLMFLHDQSSDLVLYSGHQRLGSFHLQPLHQPAGTDGTRGPVRLLRGSGYLTLGLPGENPQNIVLRGSLELDATDTLRRFEVSANSHEARKDAPVWTLALDGLPPLEQWHYQVRRGNVTLQENSGPPSILLDALDLRWLGIDPRSLLETARQQTAASQITARRGVLHTNGDDIESFIVTLRQGDTLENTIYVSQLGQILAVKTFAGYDLYDENLTP